VSSFLQNKDREKLEEHGGVLGIAEALATSTNAGLDPKATGDLSLENRKHVFGANKFREVKQKSFLKLWVGNLTDPTLVLLMFAAAVSTLS
jgi:hypothetical protein